MDATSQSYDVMVYPYHFTSKAQAKQKTGIIKNNILKYPKNMTIDEIAKACTSGQVMAFCHAEPVNNKTSFRKDSWQYQQLYAFDIDNGIMGPAGKERFKEPYYMTWQALLAHVERQGYTPAFIYTTSNHTEDWHRFRIVFALDKTVDSIALHEQTMRCFMRLLSVNGKTIVDKSCIDPSRIFYAGREIVYKNTAATINRSKLVKEHGNGGQIESIKPEPIKAPTVKAKPTKSSTTYVESTDIQEHIQQIIQEIQGLQNSSKITSNSLKPQMALRLRGRRALIDENHTYSEISVTEMEPPISPTPIRDYKNFDTFCYDINLANLLKLPFNEAFSCILPDHDDKKDSAKIDFYNGKYQYRCFGCNSTYDIYGLLERLSGCSRLTIMKWLSQKYNIAFETEWQKIQREEILFYKDYMIMALEESHPELHKALTRGKEAIVLNMLLDMARIYLLDKSYTNTSKPIFYHARSSLAKVSLWYGLSGNNNTIQRAVIHLAKLGLIELLENDEIPKFMLHALEKYRIEMKWSRRTNCFAIPYLTQSLLDKAQDIVLADKKNNVRKSFQCREQLARANGTDVANEVYVQDKNDGFNEEVEKFYKRYKAAAQKLLDKKGWTTEEEIINRLKGFDKVTKVNYSGICLPQLLRELDLQRVAFSKVIEKTYAVKSRKKLYYGASKIIIPADDKTS